MLKTDVVIVKINSHCYDSAGGGGKEEQDSPVRWFFLRDDFLARERSAVSGGIFRCHICRTVFLVSSG